MHWPNRHFGDAFRSIRFSTVWVLIIVPLLSIAFITVSGESPLYTSISRIAWVKGHRIFMIIWSLIVLFPMVCLTRKVISESRLSEKRKSLLNTIAIANILLSFTCGVFVPAKNGVDAITIWGAIHDCFTALGWLSFAIVLTIYAFSLRRFSQTQATISISFMGFIWITGLFFIFYVIDPNTYCGTSAITQVYIINMLDMFLLFSDIYQSISANNRLTSGSKASLDADHS